MVKVCIYVRLDVSAVHVSTRIVRLLGIADMHRRLGRLHKDRPTPWYAGSYVQTSQAYPQGSSILWYAGMYIRLGRIHKGRPTPRYAGMHRRLGRIHIHKDLPSTRYVGMYRRLGRIPIVGHDNFRRHDNSRSNQLQWTINMQRYCVRAIAARFPGSQTRVRVYAMRSDQPPHVYGQHKMRHTAALVC